MKKKSINTGKHKVEDLVSNIENLHPAGCDCIQCVDSELFSDGMVVEKSNDKSNGSFDKFFDEQTTIQERSLETDDLKRSEEMLEKSSGKIGEEEIVNSLQKTMVYATSGGLLLMCVMAMIFTFTKDYSGGILSILVGLFLMIVNERINK